MAETKKKTRSKARSKARSSTKTRPAAAAAKKPNKPARPKKGRTPVFKKADLTNFKNLLLAEQSRLKEELEEIEERAARALEIEAAGEISDYDEHPADMASETFEREKDIAMAESTASLLAKVNNALTKIDKGTYGVCDICGGPIKKMRLKAIPHATLCVDCQERMEL